MSDEMDSAAMEKARAEVMRALMKAIDDALIGRVEEIEGRVPNNDELKRHACTYTHANGRRDYFWKGKAIGRVMPPTAEEPRFTILPQR